MFIAILTLLSALSISGVAIFYSVIGLATIFPGAFWPVVIMGSVLAVSYTHLTLPTNREV